MSDLHRKQRLAHLIATDFGGRQDSFVQKSGRGKGRVSQMLGAEHPFGEKAARLLAEDVGLHPDWFNHSWPTPNEVAQGMPMEGNGAPGQVDAPKHPAPAVSASELLMQLASILETLTPGAAWMAMDRSMPVKAALATGTEHFGELVAKRLNALGGRIIARFPVPEDLLSEG